MISSFAALGFWLTSISASWPNPYIGMSFRTFPEKTTVAAADPDDDPTDVSRRGKFLQIGAPFELHKVPSIPKVPHLPEVDLTGLRILAVPEILFSEDVFILNLGVGVEEDTPFRNYRSVPASIFWGITGGMHWGYLMDPGGDMGFYDRTSLAFLVKLYFGPRFHITQKTDLKLRLGTDMMFGQIGQYQTQTSFSEMIGSVLGVQLQLAFR